MTSLCGHTQCMAAALKEARDSKLMTWFVLNKRERKAAEQDRLKPDCCACSTPIPGRPALLHLAQQGPAVEAAHQIPYCFGCMYSVGSSDQERHCHELLLLRVPAAEH